MRWSQAGWVEHIVIDKAYYSGASVSINLEHIAGAYNEAYRWSI